MPWLEWSFIIHEARVYCFLFRSIIVDHTTSTPSLAERIFKEAAKYQVGSVDAPVSGGDVGAREGRLVTMCGG